MKIIMGFPLEAQKVSAPDGLPRATCQLPVGAKIIHLGVAYPSDVICIFALVDHAGGEQAKELQTLEFAIVVPGNPVPADFVYRAPIRTKIPPLRPGDPPGEGLIFVFEKQAPKLMIVTPGGRA